MYLYLLTYNFGISQYRDYGYKAFYAVLRDRQTTTSWLIALTVYIIYTFLQFFHT